jgi:hypothetical protein
MHDLRNVGEAPGIDGKAGLHRSCPLDEELHSGGLDLGCVVPVVVRCWQCKRTKRKLPLGREPQTDPAGDQELHTWAVPQHFAQEWRSAYDLLEVVQHQQDLHAGECPEEPLLDWLHAHVS